MNLLAHANEQFGSNHQNKIEPKSSLFLNNFVYYAIYILWDRVMKSFDLLEDVLSEIENSVKKDISIENFVSKFSISRSHLKRIFSFAFNQPIAQYIRSRKLASSLEDLLKTNTNVLDIAVSYGFGYEQTYIRAFKREFGITPGELRKTGKILKIKPPLHLFDYNKLADGLIFGPDIVMLPEFHVIGKKYKMLFRNNFSNVNSLDKYFCENLRSSIPNKIKTAEYINICTEADTDEDFYYLMPSIPVKSLETIPEGFDSFSFPSSLCARFRFIAPADAELNIIVADGMFKAINDFMDDENQSYFLERKRINIDRINQYGNNKEFLIWEWFSPVIIKTKENIPLYSKGIIETYKQKIPQTRFIGKCYKEKLSDFSYKKILDSFNSWCTAKQFEKIEKLSDFDLKAFYDGANAYICMIRKTEDGFIEYYLGMFMPKETDVPKSYDTIDFQKSEIAVSCVYGKRNQIINYENECRKKLVKENLIKKTADTKEWFFLRFNWYKYFNEDKFGSSILEYCYYV